jgi:cholesterol transport system auxiliary component
MALGLMVVGLGACGSIRKVDTYSFDARIFARPVAWSSGKALLVSEPRGQSGVDGRAMVYALSPRELGYYADGEWAESVPRMLLPVVVRMLQDIAAFKAVVTPLEAVAVDLRLELEVIRLQNELWETPSRVRLTLRAKLFDESSDHVLGTQLFETAPPAPSEDAAGLAKGAEVAIGQLLPQLRDFVLLYAPGAARS